MSQYLQGNNPANDPDKKPVKGRSKFRPNRSFFQTMQFGLNTPHFAMETVEGDHVSVRVATDLDTQSLKAPLMQPVRMNKDYFFAPLRAILPLNAERLVTNPLSGEDIVPEDVNCVIKRSDLYTIINTGKTNVNAALSAAGSADGLKKADAYLIKALVIAIQRLEPFTSAGCLLNVLGHGVAHATQWGTLANGKKIYFDKFLDALCVRLREDVDAFSFTAYNISNGGNNYVWSAGNIITVKMALESGDSNYNTWSFPRFLEYLRQGGMVVQLNGVDLLSTADTTRRALNYDVNGNPTAYQGTTLYPQDSTKYINLSRLVAYQLACVQFYTDDAVDYIYDCDLWHQNMKALRLMVLSNSTLPQSNLQYKLNGIPLEYDSISGAALQYIAGTPSVGLGYGSMDSMGAGWICDSTDANMTHWYGWNGFIINLFGFTRSLKFRDYFCGSRPHPLAVGNTSVAVSGGSFSVVDVTKNIQIQRFLNQVNRVGRKFQEYVKGIFGVTPAYDPCTLIYLGHTSDMIGASETENTGSAQLTEAQTVTSKLRKNSSQFAFEGTFNEAGILIGITNFDAARPYVEATDRAMLHVDRFDMFNPFMQQIGDQEVAGVEIRMDQSQDFGYKLRYSEYKQSFDRAVGGFLEYLPGFSMLNEDGAFVDQLQALSISPDFIRSRPSEFDRFYVALTAYSLAGRFHFQMRQDISVEADRPMEAAPSIL